MSTADAWMTIFFMVTFTLLIANQLFTLYIAYTKMDAVLELMSKASNRAKHMPYCRGPKGKFFLLATLCGIAVFPKSALTMGDATIEEIESIPLSFVRTLKVILWIDFLTVSIALISWALGK